MLLRVLTARDVRAALPMTDAIDAMREAFSVLVNGGAELPLRTRVQLPGTRTISLAMPGAVADPRRLGAKLLTLNEDNPGRHLPVIHGVVVMFDPHTGQPVGLLEGTSLTALRTGAVSGLATDLLALPDAATVAIIGAGAQAPAQLEAVCVVRPIHRARIWSRSFSRAAALAEALRGRPGFPAEVDAVRTVDEALHDADVVCTATPATSPLIHPRHAMPGLHINAIGAFTPQMTEIALGVVQSAHIVVDERDAAMAESGELIAAVRAGVADAAAFVELGALVEGRAQGRTSREQVTLFKSVGLAVQDLCAGGRALEGAKRLGVGMELDLNDPGPD